MPSISDQLLREKLATVKYPGFSRDIVSFGIVKDIRVQGADVVVQLALTTNDARVPQTIKAEAEAALALPVPNWIVPARLRGCPSPRRG